MKTNLRILRKRTRRIPESGDIFVFQLEQIPEKYFFGRVVATDTKLGNLENVVLFYVYRTPSMDKTIVPPLKIEDLLMPPVGTNNIPWTKGYFEIVASGRNSSTDILPQHCFFVPFFNRYVDEYGKTLARRVEPLGSYCLSGLESIDDKISDALGILRAVDVPVQL